MQDREDQLNRGEETEAAGDAGSQGAPQDIPHEQDMAAPEGRPDPDEAPDESAEAAAQTESGEAGAEHIPVRTEGERSTFATRMADAGYSVGRRYDAVKNAFLSYKSTAKKPKQLRARITSSGETFGVGRNLLAKLVLVGGYLRLFLALDPNAYNPQKYHHKDYTEVVRYAKTPFMIKLSSDRQVRYALELIDELMRANSFEPDETYVPKDQAGIFQSPRRKKVKVVYVGSDGAEIAAARLPVRDALGEEPDEESDAGIGEPEAIDVRLPRRGTVADKKGNRVGKIRKCIWRDENGEENGEFRKEDVNVFLYANDVRTAYVDKNDNILTLDHTYVATIRRFGWLPILIIVIILAAATVLSAVLSSYFLSRSENSDYAPVLFIAHEDGTQWQEQENLPVFLNERFGDSVIAPGMNGTYRFTLRNDNRHALVFSLAFDEENEYGIGLGYKLKRDGVYIAGEAGHLQAPQLSVADMTIEAHSSTVFEIEWYWRDNDAADTAAGENGADYTLHISFTASVRA